MRKIRSRLLLEHLTYRTTLVIGKLSWNGNGKKIELKTYDTTIGSSINAGLEYKENDRNGEMDKKKIEMGFPMQNIS